MNIKKKMDNERKVPAKNRTVSKGMRSSPRLHPDDPRLLMTPDRVFATRGKEWCKVNTTLNYATITNTMANRNIDNHRQWEAKSQRAVAFSYVKLRLFRVQWGGFCVCVSDKVLVSPPLSDVMIFVIASFSQCNNRTFMGKTFSVIEYCINFIYGLEIVL